MSIVKTLRPDRPPHTHFFSPSQRGLVDFSIVLAFPFRLPEGGQKKRRPFRLLLIEDHDFLFFLKTIPTPPPPPPPIRKLYLREPSDTYFLRGKDFLPINVKLVELKGNHVS